MEHSRKKTDMKILVVHRRSKYNDMVSSRRDPKVTLLIENSDSLVTDIVKAHENHVATMNIVAQVLNSRNIDATWRNRIHGLDPDDFDMVITIGGDGTVLHASHAIQSIPILAVNSSPSTSFGYFTCADAQNFEQILDNVLGKKLPSTSLSRMEVRVNGEVVTNYALNDVLFCHDCPASTTRYVINYNGITEDQLSSGIWISTAAGSTAAIRAAGGKVMPCGSKRLQFAVREPFSSGFALEKDSPQITNGFISSKINFSIFSKTVKSRLYIDGPHVVFPVGYGDKISFAVSAHPLTIYGYEKSVD